MLKWCRTVLCSAHGEGLSAKIAVCNDRRALRALMSSYERSKFAIQHVDFCVPCKMVENYIETV